MSPRPVTKRRPAAPLLLLALLLGACAPATTGRPPAPASSVPSPAEVLTPAGVPAAAPSPPAEATFTPPTALTTAPRVSLRADSGLTAPLEVTFTASLPAGGRADWQFADGTAATGASVTHVFYAPGQYAVQARMQAGGHEYLASVPLSVRSAGPEVAAAVLLQDAGTLALSAQGSVVYAPYTPQFLLDGRAVTPSRQPLAAGTHTLQVRVNAPSGSLTRSYSLRTRAPLSVAEASRQADYEAEVLRLTNVARVGGWDCKAHLLGGLRLPPLRSDPQLVAAARAQSVGMALNGYFDHRSAVDGSMPDARVRASGYRATSDAENIAAGQPTPKEVVDAWLHSAGHCPNIMGDYDDLGVAYIHQDDSQLHDYWTQVFGRKGE